MSDYLQRLFDRMAPGPAAPSAGLATPAGPSLSPIAAADQRLNDPALAARFDLAGLPPGDEPDPAQPAQPPSFVTLRPVGHVPGAAPSEPLRRGPEGAPSQPRALPLSSRSEPAPPSIAAFMPGAVGRVFPEDLEPAALPEPSLLDPGIITAEPAPHPALPAVERDTDAASPEEARVVQPRHARPVPAVEPAPQQEQPESRQPRVVPADPVVPPPARVIASEFAAPAGGAIGGPDEASPWRDARVEATPPPPRGTPAEAAPAATTKQSAAPASQTTHAADRPPADSPHAVRPMTAAQASIIGPLPVRRRAVTLFGLRRR